MSMSHGLPSFRQGTLSLSSLNVPRRFHLPIIILRLLSLIPAGLGFFRNISRAYTQPPYDDTGIFETKSTPLICCVAALWCLLAGYWSWILTTSMLRRWLYHYELNNAIVRLVTLIVINWSISAFISSYYGADQPIWKWMTICFVLLVSNVLKILLASSPKYHRESSHEMPRINHKSTVVRILVLPLSIVIFCTMFASLYQVSTLRSRSIDLLEMRSQLPAAPKHPDLAEADVRVMVFVLSAWTPKSLEKRKTFRDTTLKLQPADNAKMSFFYRFILGEPPSEAVKAAMGPKIAKEREKYGDILILDSSDLYNDLSKKVYRTMVWADQYDFDYFIKTDDDIFVRWDTISKELQQLGRKTRYWRGLAYWNIPPIRSEDNKNAELEYPLPIFPPYTAGALYILSRDVIHLIAGAGGPRMFVRNEDQNLGIWLFAYNILPIHDRRIQQINACEEDMIAKHFGDFGDPNAIGGTMYDMIENLQKGRRMCHGFQTHVCGLCYPCHNKGNHWKEWNFDCDNKKGVTLLNPPSLTIVE